jgi:N-acetylglucosaminyldiphosphoundecaprenol N-acetyl-beta-D-mannosaminyltransferase
MKTTDILGVQVHVIDRSQLLERIDALASAPGVSLVNNVNAHACNLACSDSDFREILNASDAVFCDGFGVKLAAKMLGKPLGERMTPPDWIDDLFRLCVRRRYSVYFLGDTSSTVQLFTQAVHEKHPLLRIAGFHDGFFNPEGDDGARVFRELVRLRPDVILTAMGMPRQEKWARLAKKRIGKGAIIATGALFRWYTGVERRAPAWMTQTGFEWLARLIAGPRRHFKRYVIGLPLFFVRVFIQKLKPRKSGA